MPRISNSWIGKTKNLGQKKRVSAMNSGVGAAKGLTNMNIFVFIFVFVF